MKIMQNNILSNIWLINLCVPDMRAKKNGSIIIVSSIGGVRGSTGDRRLLHLQGRRHAARAQPRRRARAPTNPRQLPSRPAWYGPTSPRRYGTIPSISQGALKTAPLRRIGEPDDIGGIAVMLAGKAGAFITGQTIIADAGVTIGA